VYGAAAIGEKQNYLGRCAVQSNMRGIKYSGYFAGK
jgi:hypothetical protein